MAAHRTSRPPPHRNCARSTDPLPHTLSADSHPPAQPPNTRWARLPPFPAHGSSHKAFAPAHPAPTVQNSDTSPAPHPDPTVPSAIALGKRAPPTPPPVHRLTCAPIWPERQPELKP